MSLIFLCLAFHYQQSVAPTSLNLKFVFSDASYAAALVSILALVGL
jgi:hypothetical protein